MQEIRAIQKELREAMAARQSGAQTFIRGLTAEVATQQEQADQLPASQVGRRVVCRRGVACGG